MLPYDVDYDTPPEAEETRTRWTGDMMDPFESAKPGDEIVWKRVARSGDTHLSARRVNIRDLDGNLVPLESGATFVGKSGSDVLLYTHSDHLEHRVANRLMKADDGKMYRPAFV